MSTQQCRSECHLAPGQTRRPIRRFLGTGAGFKKKKKNHPGEERSGGRTVDGDAEEVPDLLDFGPCQLERPQVPQYEVVVRAAGLQLVPVLEKLICERLRILDHLLRVRFPGWLARLQ